MRILSLILTYLVITLNSIAANAAPNWQVQSYQANGSGCKSDNVEIKKEAADTLNISFSDLAITKSGRKNCVITISLEKLNKWTFAIEEVKTHYQRNSNLNSSTKVSTYTYFQGESQDTKFVDNWSGKHNGEMTFKKMAEKPVFAPCDKKRSLNINTALRNRGKADVKISSPMQFKLLWRKCK